MIGISSSFFSAHGYGIYDSVRRASDLGFDLVEMGAAHRHEAHLSRTLHQVKRDFPRMEFTVHAYFPPIYPGPHHVEMSEGLVKTKRVIDSLFSSASILEAKVVSMHPGSKTSFVSSGKTSPIFTGFNSFRIASEPKPRDELLPRVEECIDYCLEKSLCCGIPFAVETLQRHSYSMFFERDEYLALFAKYPDLRLLIDIGHCLETFGDPYWFMDTFGDRVAQMHMHDYDGTTDHIPLGTGVADLEKIFSYPFTRGIPLIFEHAANVSEDQVLAEKRLLDSYLR